MQQPLRKTSSGYWPSWLRKMKKISGGTALGAALLLGGSLYSGKANAQLANQYNFEATPGTFTPLAATATQVPLLKADTYIMPATTFPNGFVFNFEGTNYTQFRATSNGTLVFNSGTSSSGTTNELASVSTNSRPLLAPLWDDLDGNATGSNASYEVTGTAGSQIFTFEWLNWEFNYASSSPVLSFQVKLYEATGKIEFIYRQESGAVTSGSASIGIAGAAAGNFLSLNNTSTNPAVSSTSETTSIASKPATGQIYTFTKPVATDIAATALASPGIAGCAAQNQTVSITVRNAGTTPIDFTVNPVTVTASATGPNPATFPAAVINTGTLAPGATQNVIVSTTYDMSTAGSYVFTATTAMAGDGFAGNNTLAPVTINRTVVAPVALPQNVNFTGYTGSNLTSVFPNWSEASGVMPTGTSSDWTSDDYANVTTGTNGTSAKINLYTNSFRAWLMGPKVTATATTVLKFDLALTAWGLTTAATLGSDDEVKVMVSNDCGASWTAVRTYNASSTISNTGQTEMISLAAYAGQDIIIGFYATDGTTDNAADNDIFIDNIFIGTPPTIDLGGNCLDCTSCNRLLFCK